jgi:hypothetical protein
MTSKRKWLSLIVVLFLFPAVCAAAPVYELQDFIFQKEIIIEEFTADIAPTTYKATLTDLSYTLGLPDFEKLNMSITNGPQFLGNTIGPGSFFFEVVLGETYFLNIFGKAGCPEELGLFNVTIEAVPIPPAALLLGSGILGLVMLRRRARG